MKTILKSASMLGLAFTLHFSMNVQAAGVVIHATELSGSASVLDGKGLLIADDDLVGAVLFVSGQAAESDRTLDATLVNIERKRGKVEHEKDRYRVIPVQDFEGIASDGKEEVFFIGSHQARYDEGDDERYRRFGREFLIHARLKKDKTRVELKLRGEYYGLLDALKKPFADIGLDLFPSGCFCGKGGKTLHPDRDLNMEGLAYRKGKLYIGFRAPLTEDGKAIIAIIDAEAPFEKNGGSCGKKPKVDVELRQVALDGAGIRSLGWEDREEGEMLILSGSSDSSGKEKELGNGNPRPTLWRYDLANGKLEKECAFTDEALNVVEENGGKKMRSIPEGVSGWGDNGKVVVFDNEESSLPAKIAYLPDPAICLDE